jgi:hypothetical protein
LNAKDRLPSKKANSRSCFVAAIVNCSLTLDFSVWLPAPRTWTVASTAARDPPEMGVRESELLVGEDDPAHHLAVLDLGRRARVHRAGRDVGGGDDVERSEHDGQR